MINSFFSFEKQLIDNPEFQWLTIINSSGTTNYTYKDLHSKILDYVYLLILKNQ